MDVNSSLFQKKCCFQLSLRYELFLALGAAVNEDSDLYISWREDFQKSASKGLIENLKLLGSSADLWTLFATLLPVEKMNPNITEIVADLQNIELAEFQRRIIEGILHNESSSRKLCRGEISLRKAINQVPVKKREWLVCMGLYPYERSQPFISALELLLSHPDVFRRLVMESVQLFWDDLFKKSWGNIERDFRRSLEKSENLFSELPFEEFAERRFLKITFAKNLTEILALHGGYRLPVQDIDVCVFMPSIFNERRLWSALKTENGKNFVYFPYFDPSLKLAGQSGGGNADKLNTNLDPALIFKALGDGTRFGIVTLLKSHPKTATEMADDLGLSKATVSHHLALLREAGIIHTEASGFRNAVLQVNEDVIGSLSEIYLKFLNNRTKRRK